MLSESQKAFDQDHIWHPYTSLTDPLPVYPVKSAKGMYLTLESGEKLLDGMASWWCAIHGYNQEALNKAIKGQLDTMAHVMFGGITHQPAIDLCQKLVEITPKGLDKVFLCDSGSVSVEVAIKMAFQYWVARNNTSKTKLMTVRKGYHGDTFGAMSVCDPVGGMHHLFNHLMPNHIFINEPQTPFSEDLYLEDIDSLEKNFEEHAQHVAAFILEPVVQGAGGMRIYSPQYLKKLKELCNQYDVLLILDEIATGFGRTGEMFAADHAQISPDIMCLGKALTGGTMTMAATLCTHHVAHTICESEAGVLMHGPTFMANPLACSVSLASIRLLESYDWKAKVNEIERILVQGLSVVKDHPRVKEVRILGAIGVIECTDVINVAVIQEYFVRNKVWIRPFRNLIYIMPPYLMLEDELNTLSRVMISSLDSDTHFKK